ncbi:MAG: fdxN element excision recombinase XisF [Oculatellaceae cyanobacterium bins.114]|nr:fdxN element excision recombinase XisF [Oculatellaceae cyanobacterium bins.114]
MSEALICGYARVSTEEQAHQVALSNQIKRLRDSGCQRIYADVASRADSQRDGILQLISDIEAGLVGELRITRLDRITASPALFEQLVDLLKAKKVALTGLDEYLDITSADGEFSAGLQIYFGKREVRTIQLRSQRGHEIRQQNRRPNPSVPWGYRSVNRTYKLDSETFLCLLSDRSELTRAQLARDVIDLFFVAGSLSKAVGLIHTKYGVLKRGHPKRNQQVKVASYVVEDEAELRAIAPTRNARKGVFQWSHDGLARWLRNPVLRGHTPYNTRKYLGTDAAGRKRYGNDNPREQWQVERDTHPDQRLMSEEEYEQIEQILSYNAKTRGFALIGGSDRRYPVSGLLVCGECGSRMKSQGSKVRQGKKINYYRCKNSLDKACTNTCSLRGDRAEELIIAALTTRAEAIALAADESEEIASPELAELKEQLQRLESIPGSNPAIEAAKVDLQGQIERLIWGLKQKKVATQAKQLDLVETLQDPDYWETLSDSDKGKLFRWLVKDVVVKEDRSVRVELDV